MKLPLFPLNTVLFPGCTLDLQIFEARYLDMIGRCMKRGEGFGVVCILEGEQVGKAPPVVASIGCEAVIRDFVQQDNGLLGIRVEGVRRFNLESTEVQKDQLLSRCCCTPYWIRVVMCWSPLMCSAMEGRRISMARLRGVCGQPPESRSALR